MASPDDPLTPERNTTPKRKMKTRQAPEAQLSRFGPFERTIRTKDLILLHDEIRQRLDVWE